MLTKIVNGIEVQLTAEEETAQLAEWAANDAASKVTPPKKLTIDALADLLKAKLILTDADIDGAKT